MKQLINALRNRQSTRPTHTLNLWREQALNTILYVAIAIGFITLAGSIANILTTTAVATAQLTVAIMYASVYLIIVGITLVRSIGFRIRSILFIISCFVYGLLDLIIFGFLSTGLLFFFTCTILTALFFRIRFSVGILALNVLTMGIIGYMLVQGLITPTVDVRILATDPGEIIAHILTWFVLNSLLIGAIVSLVSRLSHSLQAAETATHEALHARYLAEQHAAMLTQQTNILACTEQRLRDLVATLDTPTIPLTQGILLAAIVGTVDMDRAQNINRRLLSDVQCQNAHTILIDMSGVTIADTRVARDLIDTSQALHLMGCEVILTGIAPSLAATLTTLEIDASIFKTAHSPRTILKERQLIA